MKYFCYGLAIIGAFCRMASNGFGEPVPIRAQSTNEWSEPVFLDLPSERGTIRASMRHTRVLRTNEEGVTQDRTITEIAVPSKELFWINLDEKLTYFVLRDCIVGTRDHFDWTLLLFPSWERNGPTGNQGVIQASLESKLQNIDTEHLEYRAIKINIEDYLGPIPFNKFPNSFARRTFKVEGVLVAVDHFSIQLSGLEDESVKAVFTFSNEFKVLNVSYKGQQVFPK